MYWIYYNQFSEFDAARLYDVLKLRQDIFIIEQNCIYDDIDGLDKFCTHLLMYNDDENLTGYLRIVPDGKKFEQVSLGRIVVRKKNRGQGYGKKLIKKGLSMAVSLQGTGSEVIIEAQAHLEEYYQKLGFKTISETYDVDDIPHLQMVYAYVR